MGEFHIYKFDDVPVRYDGQEAYATGEAELYYELELPDPDVGINNMDANWEVSTMALELLDEDGQQLLLTGDAAIDCMAVYKQIYRHLRDTDVDVVNSILQEVEWS